MCQTFSKHLVHFSEQDNAPWPRRAGILIETNIRPNTKEIIELLRSGKCTGKRKGKTV